MTPDPLKAKPETLGFEREAEEIYIPWNTDDDQYRWVCRKAIAAALEAAFSKGTEEGYRKGKAEAYPNVIELGAADTFQRGFSDGWNACREASAKVATDYARQLNGIDIALKIRALKPAKGESK